MEMRWRSGWMRLRYREVRSEKGRDRGIKRLGKER